MAKHPAGQAAAGGFSLRVMNHCCVSDRMLLTTQDSTRPAGKKKNLTEIIGKMVKSAAWKDILKQKGWDDAYLADEAFAKFLKDEQARVNAVLKSVGLVKS